MIQKLTFFLAALVSALVIAAGLAVAGLSPTAPAAAPATVSAVEAPADPAAATGAAATPVVQVDTIYVAPQPTPQEIVVKEASTKQHDDDENEGEDD